MNGQDVFEKLKTWTPDDRKRFQFPGWFGDFDYDAMIGAISNNADLDEEEYEIACDVENDIVCEWVKEAIDKEYEAWSEYVEKIHDYVALKLMQYAKNKENSQR